MKMELRARAKQFFELDERGSTFSRELLAGVSTYLSLAYIFVVNPAILSQAGIDVSAVLFATIVASAASTLLMGFWARLPFALAPGLEMNGFFAFVVVGTLGISWQAALGAVFWSGVLCLLFTVIPARAAIIRSIPAGLKTNIAVSVGFFVFAIGLHLSHLLTFDGGSPKAFGSPLTTTAIALYIGLGLCILLGLRRLRFPGGMLVAVVISAVYCRANGIYPTEPAELSIDMFSAFWKLDLVGSLRPTVLPVLLVLFLIDYFGSIGKFIGLTQSTAEMLNPDRELKGMKAAMLVDGVGTSFGAVLGTSSIITYVESAVGIAAGGRTGIAAIVCGILMLGSIVFTDLVGLVPVEATAGVLCYVAYLLIPWGEIRRLFGRRYHQLDALPERVDFAGEYSFFDFSVGIAMAAISLFTFSLDKAMLVGFGAYSLSQWLRPSGDRNLYLLGSALLLLLSFVLQNVFR